MYPNLHWHVQLGDVPLTEKALPLQLPCTLSQLSTAQIGNPPYPAAQRLQVEPVYPSLQVHVQWPVEFGPLTAKPLPLQLTAGSVQASLQLGYPL